MLGFLLYHSTNQMSYHQFTNEQGDQYGSFEVFFDNADTGPGFYWWPCFPGCLPDGEPIGPFQNEQEAITDALSD